MKRGLKYMQCVKDIGHHACLKGAYNEIFLHMSPRSLNHGLWEATIRRRINDRRVNLPSPRAHDELKTAENIDKLLKEDRCMH